MKNWQEFIHQTPDDYNDWILGGSKEAAEVEIAELIRLSASGKKIIVDTNIPIEILKEISDYNHVAVMLNPQSMSVEKFFDREDPEKQFILKQIEAAKDPEKAMDNFKACIAIVNSKKYYDKYASSGFFTVIRENTVEDTREEVMTKLAKHFALEN